MIQIRSKFGITIMIEYLFDTTQNEYEKKINIIL